jgi:polar amino acid transport system permease protein
VVAYLVVTRSPGWPRVQATFFSLEVARESFPTVLEGLWLNLQVLVVGGALVLVLGLTTALLRTLRGPAFAPLRIVATVYVDLFRGMPLIIVLYLVGFGFPALGLQGVPTSPFVLGTAAIVLVYSAYVAEVFRAGIESVHPSQRAAASSLGLTGAQTMRFVVLPQAVRRVIPPLLNDFIALQKDVALVAILGPLEAFRQAQVYAASNFNYTPLLGAAALYLCVTIPLARIVDRMQRRDQLLRAAGGAV